MKRILNLAQTIYAFLIKYIYLLPIIQIIATFVVSFFDLTEYQWLFLGNSVGYSILTGLVYVVLFWSPFYKFCYFTKLAAVGLLLMAIYNFIGKTFEYKIYVEWFDRIIFVTVLLLVLILNIKKESCVKLLKKITK
jgi:hypothetical protein